VLSSEERESTYILIGKLAVLPIKRRTYTNNNTHVAGEVIDRDVCMYVHVHTFMHVSYTLVNGVYVSSNNAVL
jgi:hypothetical protein